ncbi:MAG: histidinol dehydrogenase [Buchnera aphidicola (Brevicoryne brassicae)]|uniref:Histidinol dehydrogenase n=1 Tax=Buchnera aphidicola (Brevicoryne brassicae) TaxID=911343 RepID=A0AAJ5PUR5_9GAMM|nr:histidinol dehydrogenase [Buchnera aphidicola]QCI19683.1 histidinol dehydrogenase [Buchnera aphidicola (Brevicoryne brassicae)]WAI19051.1 MAG: histidinol dehydrogenase [Buchnera aphidicola (Brevicoryne brassicae)]
MAYFKNIFHWDKLNFNEQKKILSRPVLKESNNIKKTVKKIIENVITKGDKALKKYSILFDKFYLDKLQIPEEKISSSSFTLSEKLKDSILVAKKNITSFHEAQISSTIDIETQNGVRCQQISVPLNSIGIYIPGGTAPLFSTVLMLAIPAKISGCKEIILCSPPPISNKVLYASHVCGINKIFQIGGAQAIAALAFGTESIPKVDKIFGPGNVYVTEAKLQVSSVFNGSEIDMLAGPSELLVIADETANPDFIAADLLSQAEHGMSSQVILLTPCIKLSQKVVISLNQQIKKLSRLSEISKALKNSMIIIAKDITQCVYISNIYAPEHLIIQTKDPRKILNHISNASSIFLGQWSPESAGDYASGTNHVLPTYGKSITNSALGLADFQKRILIQELTSHGLIELSKTLEILSSAEKLDAHKNAVKIRVDFLKEK